MSVSVYMCNLNANPVWNCSLYTFRTSEVLAWECSGGQVHLLLIFLIRGRPFIIQTYCRITARRIYIPFLSTIRKSFRLVGGAICIRAAAADIWSKNLAPREYRLKAGIPWLRECRYP